jgi:Tol biopolymer transport system component
VFPKRFFKMTLPITIAILASGCPGPSTPLIPEPTGKIVYVVEGEIWRMNADGSGQTQLTNVAEMSNIEPSISPDGTRIAFSTNRDGNWEVYVMDVDGSNLRNITNHPSLDNNPRWSWDGTKIVFRSERDGNAEIYIMNPDGSGLRRVTNEPSAEFSPSLSPDSSRVVFLSTRSGATEVWVANADGSGWIRLTNNNALENTPSWAPNRDWIAFSSDLNGWPDIFIVNLSRGTVGVINRDDVENRYRDLDPCWSPDGEYIAYVSPYRYGDVAGDEVFLRRVYDDKWYDGAKMITRTEYNNESGCSWGR